MIQAKWHNKDCLVYADAPLSFDYDAQDRPFTLDLYPRTYFVGMSVVLALFLGAGIWAALQGFKIASLLGVMAAFLAFCKMWFAVAIGFKCTYTGESVSYKSALGPDEDVRFDDFIAVRCYHAKYSVRGQVQKVYVVDLAQRNPVRPAPLLISTSPDGLEDRAMRFAERFKLPLHLADERGDFVIRTSPQEGTAWDLSVIKAWEREVPDYIIQRHAGLSEVLTQQNRPQLFFIIAKSLKKVRAIASLSLISLTFLSIIVIERALRQYNAFFPCNCLSRNEIWTLTIVTVFLILCANFIRSSLVANYDTLTIDEDGIRTQRNRLFTQKVIVGPVVFSWGSLKDLRIVKQRIPGTIGRGHALLLSDGEKQVSICPGMEWGVAHWLRKIMGMVVTNIERRSGPWGTT